MEKLPLCEFAPYAEFDELADWSRQVKIKAGWVCEFPGCGQLDKMLLESHHIKPVAFYPDLAKDLKNGNCRCIYHHAVEHWQDVNIRNMILARLAIIYHLRYGISHKQELQQTNTSDHILSNDDIPRHSPDNNDKPVIQDEANDLFYRNLLAKLRAVKLHEKYVANEETMGSRPESHL
jgi:hypothetical protein